MLDKVVTNIVNESIDWFFSRILAEHYDKRREILKEFSDDSMAAIDYLLATTLTPAPNQTSAVTYPPLSAKQWKEQFLKLEDVRHQQILLIYLKLDVGSYLSQKDGAGEGHATRTRTKDKVELNSLETLLGHLINLPQNYDFANSTNSLATGLWAVDNNETDLTVCSLSNPTINLANYFESPKEVVRIITESLIISHNPRMALYISRVHKHANWEENYDRLCAFLLISSGQLVEALKYVRLFTENDDYPEILQQFFEICHQFNSTLALNCLNLTIEEEEALNQHLSYESRPITPASLTGSLSATTNRNHSQQNQNQSKSTSKSTSSRPKPRNRSIQSIQRVPSFNDSPARNTRSARKKKTVK